ncbi:unnamed protein product, partial [Ilex paraguariensis]
DHISILLVKCMVIQRMRIVMLVIFAMLQSVKMIPLSRVVVVHGDPDDLGKGEHQFFNHYIAFIVASNVNHLPYNKAS